MRGNEHVQAAESTPFGVRRPHAPLPLVRSPRQRLPAACHAYGMASRNPLLALQCMAIPIALSPAHLQSGPWTTRRRTLLDGRAGFQPRQPEMDKLGALAPEPNSIAGAPYAIVARGEFAVPPSCSSRSARQHSFPSCTSVVNTTRDAAPATYSRVYHHRNGRARTDSRRRSPVGMAPASHQYCLAPASRMSLRGLTRRRRDKRRLACFDDVGPGPHPVQLFAGDSAACSGFSWLCNDILGDRPEPWGVHPVRGRVDFLPIPPVPVCFLGEDFRFFSLVTSCEAAHRLGGWRVADPPREVRALGGAPFVAFTSKGCGFFTDLTLRRVARPPRDFSESGHPRLAPRELVSEVVSSHRELS